MKYPSWCCQKCGQQIGWIGRFVFPFFHTCKPIMQTESEKVVDQVMKEVFGKKYNPNEKPKDIMVEMISCCSNPKLRGTTGDLLGFSIIKCNSCGYQTAGRNIDDAMKKWDYYLSKRPILKE